MSILKDKEYDVLSDKDKEVAKDGVIMALRQLYRPLSVSVICQYLLQCNVFDEGTEEYIVCDNAARAMNIVLKLELLEDSLIDTQNNIEYHKEQLKFHREALEDKEKTLRDIKDKIEALKSEE